MDTAPVLTTPFKNIALALSGGGFRAASFCLGTLSYLQHLKIVQDENGNPCHDSLLDHVSFISSASGGTITAAVYSMRRRKGVSFENIYKEILAQLEGEKLLLKALEKLNDEEAWNGGSKSRNFINAFAKAYDKDLFRGETFGIFTNEGEGSGKDFEVCFNATEFRRGLSFRFQADDRSSTHELNGNYYIHFNTRQSDTYKDVKLGDILAASSCFPSGFEPILFPEDFAYSEGDKKISANDLREALLVETYNKKINSLPVNESIGLMDGGVTDNQGLQSAMNADNLRRKNKVKEFDLILVSDVASYFMDAYQNPKESYKGNWQNKGIGEFISIAGKMSRMLNLIFGGSGLITLASLVSVFFVRSTFVYILLGFFSCVFIFSGILVFLRKKLGLTAMFKRNFDFNNFLKNKIPFLKNFSSSVLDLLTGFLKNASLGLLQQLVASRIRSVVTMVSDVNLKQVRRLIYDEFYNDARWENRRCPNFIYELSEQNIASREKVISDYVTEKKLSAADFLLLQASSKITQVAESARLTGTTLWFGPQQPTQLKEVVACGQFSTCVNLLQYVLMLENNEALIFSEPVKNMLLSVKVKLMEDWNRFKEDPFFAFEMYEKS